MVLGVGNSPVTPTSAIEAISLSKKDILPDLPFELIWKIFNHFSIQELKKICLVSKNWKAIVRSDESVYFRHYHLLKDFFQPQNVAIYDLDIPDTLSPVSFESLPNDRCLSIKSKSQPITLMRAPVSEPLQVNPSLGEALELHSQDSPEEIFAEKNGSQFRLKGEVALYRPSLDVEFQEVKLKIPSELLSLIPLEGIKLTDLKKDVPEIFANAAILYACFTEENHLVIVYYTGFIAEWRMEANTLKCLRLALIQEFLQPFIGFGAEWKMEGSFKRLQLTLLQQSLHPFFWQNLLEVKKYHECLVIRRFGSYEFFNLSSFQWRTALKFDIQEEKNQASQVEYFHIEGDILFSRLQNKLSAHLLSKQDPFTFLWEIHLGELRNKILFSKKWFITNSWGLISIYDAQTGRFISNIRVSEWRQKFLFSQNCLFFSSKDKSELCIYHLPSGLPIAHLELAKINSDFQENLRLESTQYLYRWTSKPTSTITQIEISQGEVFIPYQKMGATTCTRLMMISFNLPRALLPPKKDFESGLFEKSFYAKREETSISQTLNSLFKRLMRPPLFPSLKTTRK